MRLNGYGDFRLLDRFICWFILFKKGLYFIKSVISLIGFVWVIVVMCFGKNI